MLFLNKYVHFITNVMGLIGTEVKENKIENRDR